MSQKQRYEQELNVHVYLVKLKEGFYIGFVVIEAITSILYDPVLIC